MDNDCFSSYRGKEKEQILLLETQALFFDFPKLLLLNILKSTPCTPQWEY